MSDEVRDREKVMRSLKKSDTPILTGYQLFHNYMLPHMALDGKTHRLRYAELKLVGIINGRRLSRTRRRISVSRQIHN